LGALFLTGVFAIVVSGCDYISIQNPFFAPRIDTKEDGENTVEEKTIGWNLLTDSAAVFPRSNFTATVFDNKIWVACGQDKSSDLNDIWYSSDGENWTEATVNGPVSFGWDPAFTSFDGALWLASSSSSEGLWTSTDGVNWSEITSVPFGTIHFLVELNNQLWALDLSSGSVWKSSDGTNWSEMSNTGGFEGKDNPTQSAVTVHDGFIWVMAGEPEGIWRYDPAGNPGWTEVSERAEFEWRHWPCSVTFKGYMWSIAGWNEEGACNDVWYSSDGSTWTQAFVTSTFPTRERFDAVVFKDRIYVLGGARDVTTDMRTDVWYAE
jgi:hypothetical protein